MNWFKKTNKNKVIKRIKDILKNHPFTRKLMDDYNVSHNEIDDNLIIEIKDLYGRFAEGNGKKIVLDSKIINKNFFKENFHFVIHEFFHWIRRRVEKDFYFEDPEEIQSFILAVTWELLNNKQEEEIRTKIFPIIVKHFENESKAKEFFNRIFLRALKLYEQQKG